MPRLLAGQRRRRGLTANCQNSKEDWGESSANIWTPRNDIKFPFSAEGALNSGCWTPFSSTLRKNWLALFFSPRNVNFRRSSQRRDQLLLLVVAERGPDIQRKMLSLSPGPEVKSRNYATPKHHPRPNRSCQLPLGSSSLHSGQLTWKSFQH
jgi:hypothetical protein